MSGKGVFPMLHGYPWRSLNGAELKSFRFGDGFLVITGHFRSPADVFVCLIFSIYLVNWQHWTDIVTLLYFIHFFLCTNFFLWFDNAKNLQLILLEHNFGSQECWSTGPKTETWNGNKEDLIISAVELIRQTILVSAQFLKINRRHKKGCWEALSGGEAELLEWKDQIILWKFHSPRSDMPLKGRQSLSLFYTALTTKKFHFDIKLKFPDYISKVTYT